MKEIKTKTKIAFGVVAGAVCAAVVFAVTLPFFKTETVVKETETIEKLVIVPNTPNGVELMSTTINVEDYATYGVSETAESAKLLTVEMNPAGTYTEFDWSLVWSGTSSWASGKTVADYMTIAPTSDGSNEAVLTCLQPYGEQIVLTAVSRTNSALRATATIDYDLKFQGIGFSLTFNSQAKSVLGISNMNYNGCATTEITMPAPTKVTNLGQFTYSITGNPYLYSGTQDELVAGTMAFSGGLYVKCSDSFAEQLSALGVHSSCIATDYTNVDTFFQNQGKPLDGNVYGSFGGVVNDFSIKLNSALLGNIKNDAYYIPVVGIYSALFTPVGNLNNGYTTSALVSFLEAAKNTNGYHFDLKAVIYPYANSAGKVDLTRPVETVYKVTFSSETLTVVEPSSVAMDNAALVF